MTDDAAEYWNAFEKETGETVEAKCLGELLSGNDRGPGVWGLLILTDKSFRFRNVPTDNWILSMVRPKGRKKDAAPPADIVIARGDIAALNIEKKSFLARILGPAFQRFTISRRREPGASWAFSVDPGYGFLAALEKVAPRQTAPE